MPTAPAESLVVPFPVPAFPVPLAPFPILPFQEATLEFTTLEPLALVPALLLPFLLLPTADMLDDANSGQSIEFAPTNPLPPLTPELTLPSLVVPLTVLLVFAAVLGAVLLMVVVDSFVASKADLALAREDWAVAAS